MPERPEEKPRPSLLRIRELLETVRGMYELGPQDREDLDYLLTQAEVDAADAEALEQRQASP